MTAVVAFEEFEIDRARSELRRGGRPLKVDALVIDLLAYLASRRGDLVTHDELIKHVWGGRAVSDNVVSVSIAKLRKALGHRRGERELIVNVYGRGYRFVPSVRELARTSEPPSAPRAPSSGAPFVGRELIMARLASALSAARDRHGSLCALIGEPGIGKTRIAEALEQHAFESGIRVAWGRARELEGAPPFWLWAELLRGLLAIVSAEDAAAHLGASYAELARVLPELSGEAGAQATVSEDAARYRTFDTVARFIGHVAQHAPLLLVLDDVHRADAASLDLLCYLIDELARMPVAIVATLRTTEPRRCPVEQRHIEYVLGHRNCERIEVAPLSARDVAACTEAILGHADESLARAVFHKSEGNAFFVVELLREAGEGHADLTLPSAALDLIRQRIRRVGEGALAHLRCAAVLGRSFDLGLLSRISGVAPAALLEALDPALATECIVAAPESMARLAFGHDLIRAVLYEGLPKLERAALHLRVAEALAELARDGRLVAPAELAHHFLSALPHGDPVRAAEHGERAADAAMAVGAYADAAAILRRAQAALDLAAAAAPELRCNLHYRMCVCLRVSDARASVTELHKAVALARATSQYRLLALAGQAMVRSPGVVMMADGRRVLEDALAGLPEDEHELRSTVLAHLAWCAPYCFDRAQAESLGARALSHARASGSAPALITALRTQVYFACGPDRDEEETKRLLDEADQLAAEEDLWTRHNWSNQANLFRAAFALQRGDRAGIERALQASARHTRELRHDELIWHSDRMRVIDRLNRGELRDAKAQLRELRARAKAMGLFAHEIVCSHDALVVLRQTADLNDPKVPVTSVSRPAPHDSPAILSIKLRAALDLGKLDIVHAVFSEFVQRGIARLPSDRDYLGVLGHLGWSAIALDERARAAELYELLAPHARLFATDISFHSDGSVAHVLGLLARYLGKSDEAIACFRASAHANERMRMRVRALESRVELAATLIATASADRCTLHAELGEVRRIAEAEGLLPLLARATMLLGELH